LKYRRTRLNSEVIYSGKDFICRKTHDKKKEEVKPKTSGEKNGILLSRFSRLISV